MNQQKQIQVSVSSVCVVEDHRRCNMSSGRTLKVWERFVYRPWRFHGDRKSFDPCLVKLVIGADSHDATSSIHIKVVSSKHVTSRQSANPLYHCNDTAVRRANTVVGVVFSNITRPSR
jgi:hypothetical protein